MKFYVCLIVAILPYLATACDVDACKVGTSTGLAVGCTAVSTLAGVGTGLACTVGAIFTFGASCAAAVAVTSAIAGGCAVAGDAISKACDGCSEDDISLALTLSKIDEAKDDIIDNANGNRNQIIDNANGNRGQIIDNANGNRDQIIENANLNTLEIIDNIDEAKGEIMKNLDLLRDGNREWFQKLANTQKVQVLNQITLLRRQKKSNYMLTTLIDKADQTQNEIIETQIIAEYADPLNTIANVGRLYKRIPKGQFGLLKKGRLIEQFKALAFKVGKNGLYASIDLSFQLLLGQGSSFHRGQSVFQYQPKYCKKSYYNFFLQRISEGIILYETALVMDNDELSKTTRADWAKYFALIGEKHGIYCGCPQLTVLVKTGEISKLKQKLSFPRQSYIDNLRDAAFIQNSFTREKATRLLGVMNLDINVITIPKLEKFTVEDISLMAQLVQSQKYDYLAKTYENIQKCVNGSNNDPRLNIPRGYEEYSKNYSTGATSAT